MYILIRNLFIQRKKLCTSTSSIKNRYIQLIIKFHFSITTHYLRKSALIVLGVKLKANLYFVREVSRAMSHEKYDVIPPKRK